jgi:hypothetical protein
VRGTLSACPRLQLSAARSRRVAKSFRSRCGIPERPRAVDTLPCLESSLKALQVGICKNSCKRGFAKKGKRKITRRDAL